MHDLLVEDGPMMIQMCRNEDGSFELRIMASRFASSLCYTFEKDVGILNGIGTALLDYWIMKEHINKEMNGAKE